MTRELQIKKKAYEFGQECFPNECNIWARENYEAQMVEFACLKMAEWVDEHPKAGMVSLDKACEWLQENVNKYSYVMEVEDSKYMKVHFTDSLIVDFRKAMEE